jgi:hypothetical protein
MSVSLPPFFFHIPFTYFGMNASAIPALFLPYRLDGASSSADGSEWGILEVQSVSPPNQRSWFFTEGQVVSGKVLLSLSALLRSMANFVE